MKTPNNAPDIKVGHKTHDEIKKGLECCSNSDGTCEGCPYVDGECRAFEQLSADALALIQKLEAELEDMTARYKIADDCAKKKGEMNEKLYAELATVKEERDAAVADILYAASVYLGECDTCKNGEVCAACKRQDACDECPNSKCMCSGCGAGRSNWQWRGVQKEE